MPLPEEAVELLAALVAFPTESRTPNLGLVEFVAERAEGAGAAVQQVDGPPGRANLHLRLGTPTWCPPGRAGQRIPTRSAPAATG